jgi:hypothetical protein
MEEIARAPAGCGFRREPVLRKFLVPGDQYYIVSLTWLDDVTGGTLIQNVKFPKMMGTFMGLSPPSPIFPDFDLALFSDYHTIREPCNSGYNVSLNDMWCFYSVRKHLIQQAMERRALTKILRNITGDEYFSWP